MRSTSYLLIAVGSCLLAFSVAGAETTIRPIEKPALAACSGKTRLEVQPLRVVRRGNDEIAYNRVCEYRSLPIVGEDGTAVCQESQEECYEVERRFAGCFAHSTQIQMADGTLKPISRVRVGDFVLNPLTHGGTAVARVVAGPESKPLIEIRAAGQTLVVTQGHPMLVKKQTGLVAPAALSTSHSPASIVRKASDLTTSDSLLFSDGSYQKIESIKTIDAANEIVFNLELAPTDAGSSQHVIVTGGGIVTGDLVVQQAQH